MSGDLAVQYQKLPEWLLARRVVPEAYARLLLGIDSKVNEALEIEVSDETAKCLINEHREAMTYFAAKDIYEALAKTPAGQAKTFLGAHTDPATAKWREVVDAYRRKNLKWMSGARLLIQNVSYELPALKKHAAGCERQVSDCTQRQAELTRAEAAARARYADLLENQGIQGFDPARELQSHAAQELPKMHMQLAELLQNSGAELAGYYEAFVAHVNGSCDGKLLPLTRLVARSGMDLRVEEAIREVPPLEASVAEAKAAAAARHRSSDVEATPVSAPAPELAEATSADIDWVILPDGGGGQDAGGGGGINWDFEVSGGGDGAAAGGIDWGVTIEAAGGTEAAQPTEAGEGGIDWGAIDFGCVALDAEGDDKAGGAGAEDIKDGERLLEDHAGREMLYQEIAEVDAFLQARLAELAGGGATDGSQLPEAAQRSVAEVQALSEVASRAGDLLTGKATQRLLLLRSSQRYLDQHVKKIDIAKAQCTKPVTLRANLEKQKGEQAQEAKRTRAEAETLLAATRVIQKELEAELTAHFKSAVRIVGEINQM